MQAMNMTVMTELFEANPDVKSNKARRNLIARAAPWLTKDEAGRVLGMWLRYGGEENLNEN